jgi:hypothetical protein
MRFTFLLTVLLPLLLVARENPFTPVEIIKSDEAPETIVVDKEAVVSESEETVAVPVEIEDVSDKESATVSSKDERGKEVVNYAKVRFVFRENSAYIETKDKVLKHFAIANPPSIVVDLSSKSDFASKRRELTTRPFKKVEMGAHGDRYRVVLRLDKPHSYSLEKRRYGQLITITE